MEFSSAHADDVNAINHAPQQNHSGSQHVGYIAMMLSTHNLEIAGTACDVRKTQRSNQLHTERCPFRSEHVMKVQSVAFIALLVASGIAAPLAAQGVRFTLAPSSEYVFWDKNLGIKNDALIGGRIGADFGSLLSVSGYYHTRTGLGVTRDSAAAVNGGVLRRRALKTDLSTYGANLALRLNPGRFAPFVSVGAGILRFDPDSAPRRDLINYRYGAGFQYDLSPNARAMVMVEDSRFRLPANALFLDGTAPRAAGAAVSPNTERSNLAVSASLGFALGGSIYGDDPTADRWSAGSLPLEAFAGRLEFKDKSMPRQALVGVRTGVDVGQYVGLRGFYWQGRSSDLEKKRPLQSYGGEAQFNLNASLGPAPFLILGAGRLDYGQSYRDALGRRRENETTLILGGGIGIRLTDQIRLNASARDYVRGPQKLDSISSPDQLSHNWLYSAGVGINLGRSRRAGARPDERVGSRDEELSRELAMRRALGLSRVDTVYVERDSRTGERMLLRRDTRTGRLVRATDSRADSVDNGRPQPRMIMLPVPEFGELYVRYGDSTSRIISPMRTPEVNAAPPRTEADSLLRVLRARIDSLEGRNRQRTSDSTGGETKALRAKIDSLEAQLRARMEMPMMPSATRMSERRRDSGGVMIVPTSTNDTTMSGSSRRKFIGMELSSISPYVAGFRQFVVGVQADAGPIFGLSALRFVPDFAIGFGSGTSISLAGGAQYNFPLFRLNKESAIGPYLRGSLGFVAAGGDADSHFGVGIAYGVTYAGRTNLADSRRPQLFIEHQGIDFFAANRFLLGLRMPIR